jgi:hypothetical protein
MTDEAAMLYHPGMRIPFRKGSLGLIELAVRLGDHPERREGIADAVVVTDALGQVQSFFRKRFCTTLHLAVAHHSAPLRNEVDLDQLREALVAVLQETMQLEYVSLWLRPLENNKNHQLAWRVNAPVSTEEG